ncbi:MAG TPA: TetR/AcrR family transcriptional regulator [Acidimicrobiia bacterium]|jgi:TetR/AcrR family transcriptional regulator, cholesterol catabolism regulator|nr:TetR/AcrR family transcriptional regulator [Acidimicrobiia bacterium]
MARRGSSEITTDRIDRRRVGGATRARINRAAVELFYRQGYRATTMRDIATACDLTPAAFYNHYSSKDQLLQSIILDAWEQLEEVVDEAVAAAGKSPSRQLQALVRAMALWHCANIQQAQVANREALELSDELLGPLKAKRRAFRSKVEKVVAAGLASGDFVPPDLPVAGATRAMATIVLGFIQSISSSILESKTLTPEGLADLLAALIGRMVGGDPAAVSELARAQPGGESGNGAARVGRAR